MMAFDEAARLVRLQERIKNATYHELRKDSGHKSSEAAVSMAFCLPSMFADDQSPYWTVEAFSYVLCDDGRRGMWTAKTAGEALALAEDAVGRWCMGPEMEQFEQFMMGSDVDDPADPADEELPS